MENRPPFRTALRFWLRLGFISFGGPAGQIAIMHDELVERRAWIAEAKFLHALNYCMLLPGPEAQQLATYIGWLLHGVRGGLAAGVLFILPSVFILLGLSVAYAAYGHLPAVAALFDGLKPAVLALIVLALVRIASKALRAPGHYAMAGGAFVALYFFRVPFPLILVFALLTGFLVQRWGSRGASPAPAAGPARNSARPFPGVRQRLVRVMGVAALWALPLAVLAMAAPHFDFWRRLTFFFTKAALVTFGGAYAVLPYVAQVAVEQFHWLTREQMLDGLALGESTPGPLIMVLAFVGFWAGAGQFGTIGWGSVALLVTVYYTFLPSFVFIFAGAPLVERTHASPAWQNVLTWTTAAVVGVLLNLALYFGAAVLWPRGAAPDWAAVVWTGLSVAVLARFKKALVWWLVVSAIAGLAWWAMGSGF